MTDAVLSLQGVCAGYGTKNILQSVDLCVKENEILTLAGPNGCGKSTLLKTAAGLLPHTSGKIYIKGKVLADYAPKELAKKICDGIEFWKVGEKEMKFDILFYISNSFLQI